MTNGIEKIMAAGQRAYRATRDSTVYYRHLKNAPAVWFNDICNRRPPPLKFRNGFTWHHGVNDEPIGLFREIFIDRFYEPLSAPPGAVVLDIGANIGALTLFWAEGRPDVHVHAYEPNPECFAVLRQNVTANGLESQVRTYPEAIGPERGELELWVDVPTTLATAYGEAPVEGATKKSVPMITLDDAWRRIGCPPIWMLKIDTEGAEADILEAASRELLGNVRHACIEWHDNIVPGAFERCRTQLEATGFEFHTRVHPWNEGIFFAERGGLTG